jgi:hypothetical protein
MEKQILPGLKITFLVHLVVGLFFGLIHLLVPAWWGNLISWPMPDPDIWRTLGAATLGFTASSWFAYRATKWEQVKIVVQAEIVWTILYTLVMLWGLLFAGLPTIAWLNAVLMAGFAAAFCYFYSRQ